MPMSMGNIKERMEFPTGPWVSLGPPLPGFIYSSVDTIAVLVDNDIGFDYEVFEFPLR